ncbi:MAG TPA: YncE family protein, partial [Solirubrobacteraceae bacterium]|nr:YncE family protein [Solirubrobacteraceae bacterium]
IGADRALLNSGRQLHPFGLLVALGNFPVGGAVTPDGRFYWTVSAGRGLNDVRIVSLASGQVAQVVRLPGASGGIVMDPVRPLVYVSGVGDSDAGHAPQRTPPGTPGAGGDVIHVFRYDRSGHASFDHLIDVPAPSGASAPQNFPPTNTARVAWPDRLAIAPDGARLLVPLNLADQAAVIDVSTRAVSYVKTGNYPYGAAVSRDGKLGFVSNETPGTVSVIDMGSATKLKDIQVGGHLSHPEALLSDPHADRVYATVTNSDQVAVIDTKAQQLEHVVPVGRSEGLGTSPVALAETPDGRRLLVAEAGADELSVLALPGSGAAPAYSMIGRIPTAQYPTDVQVTPEQPCATTPAKTKAKHKSKKRRRHRRRVRRHRARGAAAATTAAKARRHRVRRRPRVHPKHPTVRAPARCSKLVYVSAKGVGTGPNPQGPQPNSRNDDDARINATQYLPLLNIGAAGIGPLPTDAQVAAARPVADRQVRPSNPQVPPADTPLRPGGPIKHVFYIVRENRTYDQILGDDSRGDGDPRLALFGGKTTPNAHALAQRYPLLDHFYANSEASIDGHFWTSAGSVSDYVHKNWFQNYGGRPRPYDFGVFSVTWPANGFLFDQADRQGISYFNYGEAIAGTVPLTDKDRTNEENQQVAAKFAKSDLGAGAASLPTNTPAGGGAVALGTQPSTCYPNDASIGQDAITKQTVFDSPTPLGAPPQSESRFNCFNQHFQTQVNTQTVPTFNYLVLSNDHTRVLSPGAYTPAAMIADNDYGLGKIVEAISHSSIWSSSAIFVTEDDSQDGADHVDAHRTVGFVMSPYTRTGAVVHTRYDMLSMIRSMELIMGMRSLYLGDALATPMYDAFQGTPSGAPPYDALAPQTDLLATNPAASSRAEARRLRFRGLDQITQASQDRLLWRSVHGRRSVPPPPGPNAVIEPAAGRVNPNG